MRFFGLEISFKRTEKPQISEETRGLGENYDLQGQTPFGNSLLSQINYGDSIGKIVVTEKTALKLSAVWACVRLISSSIATMPKNFHQRFADGNSAIAQKSPAQRIIKKPNSFMSSFIFVFVMIACKLLHGNGYARIVRDSNGWPLELIPLHPNRVEPKMEDGKLIYLVDLTLRIQPDDMLHFKGITLDGILGLSAIAAEAENLGLSLAGQGELKKFYGKGSRYDGFISYQNKFDTGAKRKTEQAFEERSAADDSPRVPILDNGAKFIQVGVNPAEGLWLEMMGYGVEDIARIFGAPPHKIGALRQSTNNNIEQQSMDYVNDCLLPHAKEFEEEVDRKLLLTFEAPDHYFKFNFNGLLRGDSQARAALYNSLFQNGGITPNQICTLEDIPTFEGGDEHFVQFNMIPVSQSAEYFKNMVTQKQSVVNTEKRDQDISELLELIKSKKHLNGHGL